jgi:hypothetical protein
MRMESIYCFIRTLKAYEASFGGETRLIFGADSPFLCVLRTNVLKPVAAKKK